MTAIDKNYQSSVGYQATENCVNERIVAIYAIILRAERIHKI